MGKKIDKYLRRQTGAGRKWPVYYLNCEQL